MGILERLGLSTKNLDYLASPVNVGFASPFGGEGWAPSIVFDEIFGQEFDQHVPMTRDEAMRIPAVSKGVHLLCSVISGFPLVAESAPKIPASVQPSFIGRTDGVETPLSRMWCTVADLVFDGRALWLTNRGAGAQITSGGWVPVDQWSIEGQTVSAYGQVLKPSEYLIFSIPLWKGLLWHGWRTLRGARDIERAWQARIKTPGIITEFEQTDDSDLLQPEVDGWVAAWERKHSSAGAAVGFTPAGLKMNVHAGAATQDAQLFLGARDSIRTDIGSFLSVDGAMLDGTGGSDSLTYQTQAVIRSQFYEFDLPFWTGPILARLSMDDVIPRGQQMKFIMPEVQAPKDPADVQERVSVTEPLLPTAQIQEPGDPAVAPPTEVVAPAAPLAPKPVTSGGTS